MSVIVADTLSSIPVETAKEIGLPYLPQIIIFGDQTFRDDSEIDSRTFLSKLRASSILPKTAAPPPALYNPIFEQYSSQGQIIIVLCPSADLSGTFRGAATAAQDFPNADIRVIDTRTIGSGLGTLVFKALEWDKAGLSADEIIQRVEEMAKRQRVYFLVDTLEYLHKGGRIGGAKALVGSLLQVKPILGLRDGRIEAVESQRTKRRALSRLVEMITSECSRQQPYTLTLMQGDALPEAQELALELEKSLGISGIKIYELPPAILVHAGPGTLAVSLFVD